MNTLMTLEEIHAFEKIREQELEEARALQSMMMPTASLSTGMVVVSHECQPVATVGGDFLDYFELTDGTVGIYLGDVCGKGLPAALYSALAVGTLRGVHKTGQMPDAVVSLLNKRLLLRGTPRRHCALQYAVFDPESCVMRITSAGMPTPLHLSMREDCRFLDLGGIPPGLFATAKYETSSINLEPGDSVLFFTDGITDARSLRDEEFGSKRLLDLCRAHRDLQPNDLLEHIFSCIERFTRGQEQYDDMAAAIFSFSGARQ
jgi:sigma-B regulation protein RsbU (phosphoserine phosphatase)